MAAKIEIKCKECGHEARVPDAFRGKKVRCLRCRAKLRVPGGPDDASPNDSQRPKRAGDRPLAESLGPKVRREVQQAIREILGDYEHAIESSGRGFDVDLRGVAFGLARTLVEDLLQAPGVRDVRLQGGTGECRITITIEGAAFDPDDSFADDDDDTEMFARPSAPGPVAFDERSDRGRPDEKSERSKPTRADPQTSATRKKDRGLSGADPEQSTRHRPEAPTRGEIPARGDSVDGGNRGRPDAPTRGEIPARLDPDADLDRQTAEAERLLDAGDLKGAAEMLEKVVAVDKNFVTAVQALGETYARMGDHERSRRAFKHLGKLMPDDAEPLILHAAASVQCNRLEDARVSLAEAIKIDPENARAYKYAAVLYDRLGDPDRSRTVRAKYETLKAARGSTSASRSSRRSGDSRKDRRPSSAGDEL